MTTVKEVCVLDGPAYGQCWGCPVRECPLWIEPNQLTAMATGVAQKAAQRLADNRTVVEGYGGMAFLEPHEDAATAQSFFEPDAFHDVQTRLDPVNELGLELATRLHAPDTKRRLQIWMAAEAAVLRVPALRGELVKAEDRYLRDWMRVYAQSKKAPTDHDVEQRDARIDRLEASIAAEVYGVPGSTDDVRSAIAFLKGHTLKATAQYRADHAKPR